MPRRLVIVEDDADKMLAYDLAVEKLHESGDLANLAVDLWLFKTETGFPNVETNVATTRRIANAAILEEAIAELVNFDGPITIVLDLKLYSDGKLIVDCDLTQVIQFWAEFFRRNKRDLIVFVSTEGSQGDFSDLTKTLSPKAYWPLERPTSSDKETRVNQALTLITKAIQITKRLYDRSCHLLLHNWSEALQCSDSETSDNGHVSSANLTKQLSKRRDFPASVHFLEFKDSDKAASSFKSLFMVEGRDDGVAPSLIAGLLRSSGLNCVVYFDDDDRYQLPEGIPGALYALGILRIVDGFNADRSDSVKSVTLCSNGFEVEFKESVSNFIDAFNGGRVGDATSLVRSLPGCSDTIGDVYTSEKGYTDLADELKTLSLGICTSLSPAHCQDFVLRFSYQEEGN
ncbi:MAG: hypothetical protein AAF939_01300 [Planctomycetota bacterium]